MVTGGWICAHWEPAPVSAQERDGAEESSAMIRAGKLSGKYVIGKEGSNRCGNYHTRHEVGSKIPPQARLGA
jgi:hypothetical protein